MTISSTANRISYSGNGTTTAFSFPYAVLAAADLVVVETVTATGVSTTKTLTTDYTVSVASDKASATVTALTAPASTVTWTIYRDPAQTQATDFVDNSPLPAASIEDALDKLTMIAQRSRDLVSRSLRQPDGDTADIDLLPAKVTRASKYLAFDADGDPVATAGTTSDVVTTTFIETLLDDDDAATARATLGAQADLDVPTQAEAEAGTATTERVWTAERVAQAIAARNDILIYQDQKASGTTGNAYTSGAWQTVTLSTEVADTGAIGALSSNAITLPAGSYEFDATVNAGILQNGSLVARLRLQNTSDSTTIIQGVNTFDQGQTSAVNAGAIAHISGAFTLAASKTLELQVRVNASSSASSQITSGDLEIYASIRFRRYAR